LQGVPAACDDGLHNGDEAGVDCGGAACRACAPTCFDGLQNGGETGVDCGGSCAFCIPSCGVPNSPDQTCQLPALDHVSPASGPTGHATLLTVHGSGFYPAGALITYTKQVLGLDTPFTHTALPRCVFGSGANRQETTATVASSERLMCRSPPTALVGCYVRHTGLEPELVVSITPTLALP
jgi:hypothetical protein|tara:strand:+ start:89 stop:631 length:543 start_codon:yes stop_codon:yes gene_type:complete